MVDLPLCCGMGGGGVAVEGTRMSCSEVVGSLSWVRDQVEMFVQRRGVVDESDQDVRGLGAGSS